MCRDAIEAADGAGAGCLPGPPGPRVLQRRAVVHAPEVMHGRLSAIFHDESPLFAGIPPGFEAVRYHSLCLRQPLPACLAATAWTADGVVMGVEHRDRPLWGVQFHPESICTNDGRALMQNFRDLTEQIRGEAAGETPRRSRAAPARRARAAAAGR